MRILSIEYILAICFLISLSVSMITIAVDLFDLVGLY